VKLEIGGEERFEASIERIWTMVNDPAVLQRCIPGCKSMTETAPDQYKIELNLKVASVGGTMEGAIGLSEKTPPSRCRIQVEGAGTLGTGKGDAIFELREDGGQVVMKYEGTGDVGGLVAGVGQRILKGVAKHLIGKFFTAFRGEIQKAAA
jgi:carbon monoxide dehydrogenase subunit G